MTTKKFPAAGAVAIEVVPYPAAPPAPDPRPVATYRSPSSSVVLGHGAFIRARAARGMRATVASLPIVRVK